MEEKRNITSGDKIPGCEKLTRPEEIQGLSKYLGAIRKTQEKWISENMPDTPLEEHIEDKVSELPDEKETLHINDLDHLPEKKVNIEPKEIELAPKRLDLQTPEDPDLPRESDKIHVREVESLPDSLVKIDVPKDVLKGGSERLIVSEPAELPEEKIGLSDDREIKLPKGNSRIHPKDLSLPKEKEGLFISSVDELPDSAVGLDIGKDPRLPKGNLRIGITHPDQLPKNKEGIHPEEPKSLGNYIDQISISEPSDLRQKRLDIGPDEIGKLPDESIGLSIGDLPDLPKDRLYIKPEDPDLPRVRLDISPEDPDLPKARLDIDPKDIEDLPTTKLGINPLDIKSLPDTTLGITPEDVTDLPGSNILLEIARADRLNELIDKLSNDELYTEVIKLLDNQSGKQEGSGNLELAGIISAYLGSDKTPAGKIKEAAGKIADLLEKQKRLVSEIAEIKSPEIPQDKRNLPEGSKRKAVGDRELYQDSSRSKMPEYRVPDNEDVAKSSTNLLNPEVYDQDRYIRRLAELAANATSDVTETWGGQISSSLRNQVLQQTLRALVFARGLAERTSGMSRDRLPGGSLVKQGLQELVRGGFLNRVGNHIESELKKIYTISKSSILSPDSHRLPDNRPSKDSNGNVVMANSKEVLQNTFYSDDTRERSTKSLSERLEEAKETVRSMRSIIVGDIVSNGASSANVASAIGIGPWGSQMISQFAINNVDHAEDVLSWLQETEDVFKSEGESGIALTLHDLCPNVDPRGVTKMEDLKKALVDSPHITTPWKLIKPGNNATLDNNAYWELIIEPYLETNENGGYSYLPSIKEINYENQVQHGHNTLFSKWIPISNFELQKSKLVSKSLGLYDGEINYPVSVEYTNELRITVVDDQYKSWRRYFQKCADVSIFFSEAHDEDYYKSPENIVMPTAIDKSKICAAYYKNITFNIKIYCMTPQYSTIRKFDLLCVMKDFSDEWLGEIEGGGQDLSISFSVVGENPPTNMLDVDKPKKTPMQKKEDEEQEQRTEDLWKNMADEGFAKQEAARPSTLPPPPRREGESPFDYTQRMAQDRMEWELNENLARQNKEISKEIKEITDNIIKDL